MKTCRVVLYVKHRQGVRRLCDISHEDVPEDRAGARAMEMLRGDPDGADTYSIGGVRIAALSCGLRLVEIAESTEYDPYEWDGRKINGWLYRRRPTD